MNDRKENFLKTLAAVIIVGVLISLIIGIVYLVKWIFSLSKTDKKDSYHGNGGWSVWYHEQEPRCHPNCDGCARCPGYKDSVNRDYLYRAYMRNTSPYAYDNNRFCTTHSYNTCDGRRSGSRAANMGKWHPIVVT